MTESNSPPSATSTKVPIVESGAGDRRVDVSRKSFGSGTSNPNPLDQLRGYKDEYQLIDWMGSSYSGTDIKVVVHLYTKSLDEDLKQLDVLQAQDMDEIERLYMEDKINADQYDRLNQQTLNTYQDTTQQFQPYQTLVLASLQTLSVQSHREKYPVRAMGMSYVKGFTRGPRTIAGSMIFTTFSEHALVKLLQTMDNAKYYGESILDTDLSSLIPDQLPPIDCTIVFANEYGSISRMGIYGLEFVNDGTTFSIEDLLSEGVMNFVARDIDVMTKVGTRRLSQMEKGLVDNHAQEVTGSSLLIAGKEQYEAYLNKVGIQRKYKGR